MKKATRKFLCRIVGHDPVPVTKIVHADGTVTFQSHPSGNRTGCHRCKTVRREI